MSLRLQGEMVDRSLSTTENIPINFDLRFEDFIDHLLAPPNIKYNFCNMWIREILFEWANDITTCGFFEKGTAPNILPRWINYVIQKLQSSEAETHHQFCDLMLLDVKSFYKFHDSDEAYCFRNEIIEKVLTSSPEEEQHLSVEGSEVMMANLYESASEQGYQLFRDQYHYLVSLVGKTVSTQFKYKLVSMAFSKVSHTQPEIIETPYMVQFPKKYMPPKEADAVRVAKVPLHAGMERMYQFTTGDDDSTDEEEQAKNRDDEVTIPLCAIIPLSNALNVNENFWDSRKSTKE